MDDSQIELATRLIENKTIEFNASADTDRYQTALLEMIKAKLNGAQPIQVRPAAVGNVVSLVEALKQSVAQTSKGKALPRASKARKIKPALAA